VGGHKKERIERKESKCVIVGNKQFGFSLA
jgi:hypothetical protein